MATIIWKRSKYTMHFFESEFEELDTKRNSSTWVIAKGNIIEGIEAKT